MSDIKKKIETYFIIYKLSDNSTKLWCFFLVIAGLLLFFLDYLFIVSLQRFLTSINLIQNSKEINQLFELNSPYIEAMIFLFFGVLRVIIVWVNGITAGLAQVNFEAHFRKIISRWSLWKGTISSGKSSTLYNDIVVGSAAGTSTIYYMIGRTIMCLSSLTVLFYYSFALTLLSLTAIIIIFPIHRMIDIKISYFASKVQQNLARSIDVLMRGIKNSLFVHIHGILINEVTNIKILVDKFKSSSSVYYALSSTRTIIPQIAGLIVIVVVSLEGATFFSENKGKLVIYLYLILRFFQTLSDISRVSANIRGNWPRLRKLSEWISNDYNSNYAYMKKDLLTKKNSSKSIKGFSIKFENIEFSWEDGSTVFKNLCLSINSNTLTVIKGPSGIGKTTLLLLITGILKPNSGDVMVSNKNIKKIKNHVLSKSAYVGPDPFSLSGTIKEFLMFGQNNFKTQNEIYDALKMANCEFVFNLPHELDYVISEQGAGLSAGQKQRLSIARAILRRPSLLLLDEASSNLDKESENKIIDTLFKLKGKMTIIIVSHKNTMDKVADSFLIFKGPNKIKAIIKKN